MRRVLLISIGLHALALASVLAMRPPAVPEPDEPARIEVIFGNGTAAPPALAAAAAPSAVAAAPSPSPPDANGVAAAAVESAASPLAVPARPAAPDPGLRVERPDPLMIPARDAVGNTAPDYPEDARRLHQQGTVLLRLHIGADGAVTRVETLQSSGSAALDAAAIAALSAWHFLPAERAGEAVASYRDQPVSFVLD